MFINKRFYIAVIVIVLCFIMGYASIFLFVLAQLLLFILLVLSVYDIFRLYFSVKKQAIHCTRECAERFSNGDENEVRLHLSNNYPFPVSLRIIDEIPDIFQIRNLLFQFDMKGEEDKVLTYS